jgi:hypothetical protein
MEDKILRGMPEYLREGKNITDFSKALTTELEIIETKIVELKSDIQLATTNSVWLEDLAKIFKIGRNVGESDNSLRSRILAFWPGYSGSGTNGDIKNVINRITGIPITEISITEFPAMKFLIEFNIGPNFELIDLVKELVGANKAAGTYPFFQINTGFTDEVTLTDNVVITEYDDRLYGQFYYNGSSLY